MFKSVGEYLRFIFVKGMGRNIPDPIFVSLVAFLVCSMLKSGHFRLHYGMVLFCSLVRLAHLSAIVVRVSSRGVGISSLSLLRHNNSLSLV